MPRDTAHMKKSMNGSAKNAKSASLSSTPSSTITKAEYLNSSKFATKISSCKTFCRSR